MSGWIVQVDPGDLYQSARFVDSHAQDIQSEHSFAQSQIQSAQPGLVGLSAAAIAEKAAEWQAVTQAFYTRLSGYSTAFQNSGLIYETTDHDNAIHLDQVGAEASRTTWV
jgi:WXG100 family type VII secretion target